jgi:hypothetical protein
VEDASLGACRCARCLQTGITPECRDAVDAVLKAMNTLLAESPLAALAPTREALSERPGVGPDRPCNATTHIRRCVPGLSTRALQATRTGGQSDGNGNASLRPSAEQVSWLVNQDPAITWRMLIFGSSLRRLPCVARTASRTFPPGLRGHVEDPYLPSSLL